MAGHNTVTERLTGEVKLPNEKNGDIPKKGGNYEITTERI